MDTSNFQDLGNSPTPSNDLHAGEFAKPSLVSPVSPLGAATFGSFVPHISFPSFGVLVRVTKDYRPEQIGQIGIIVSAGFFTRKLHEYYEVRFSFGSEYYNCTELELILPSSCPFKDLQAHLLGHLNTLLAAPVDSANIPALLFVTGKLHDVILLDADGARRLDIEPSLFNACQFLRFGFEDLTNSSKFGRRVAGVFVDAAFEKLKRAAAILSAGDLVESPHTITSGLLSHSGNLGG